MAKNLNGVSAGGGTAPKAVSAAKPHDMDSTHPVRFSDKFASVRNEDGDGGKAPIGNEQAETLPKQLGSEMPVVLETESGSGSSESESASESEGEYKPGLDNIPDGTWLIDFETELDAAGNKIARPVSEESPAVDGNAAVQGASEETSPLDGAADAPEMTDADQKKCDAEFTDRLLKCLDLDGEDAQEMRAALLSGSEENAAGDSTAVPAQSPAGKPVQDSAADPEPPSLDSAQPADTDPVPDANSDPEQEPAVIADDFGAEAYAATVADTKASNCQRSFNSTALKNLFDLAGLESNIHRAHWLFRSSTNEDAKDRISAFAGMVEAAGLKINADASLSPQEKATKLREVRATAREYVSLLLGEGLNHESAFSTALWKGHETAWHKVRNLNATLLQEIGADSTEGRAALLDSLVKHVVQPHAVNHFQNTHGGTIAMGADEFLTAILDKPAKRLLDDTSNMLETHCQKKKHDTFTAVGLMIELHNKIPELMRGIGKKAAADPDADLKAAAKTDPNNDPDAGAKPDPKTDPDPDAAPNTAPNASAKPSSNGNGATAPEGGVHYHFEGNIENLHIGDRIKVERSFNHLNEAGEPNGNGAKPGAGVTAAATATGNIGTASGVRTADKGVQAGGEEDGYSGDSEDDEAESNPNVGSFAASFKKFPELPVIPVADPHPPTPTIPPRIAMEPVAQDPLLKNEPPAVTPVRFKREPSRKLSADKLAPFESAANPVMELPKEPVETKAATSVRDLINRYPGAKKARLLEIKGAGFYSRSYLQRDDTVQLTWNRRKQHQTPDPKPVHFVPMADGQQNASLTP